MKKLKYNLKYFIQSLRWMKVYFSPFKIIKPQLYVGKIAKGVPYFYPRKWIKNKEKSGYLKAVNRVIGFDFCSLGWKTKWSDDDIRHEWNPIWSFVFFKWQIALLFIPIEFMHYWECWIYYEYYTDRTKSIKERIIQAKQGFPCKWRSYDKEKSKEITTCYWDYILKDKWKKKD